MSVTDDVTVAGRLAMTAVTIMIIWIVITAIVYGGFLLVWPVDPDAGPWVHAGVFAFPFFGYLAHLVGWTRTL